MSDFIPFDIQSQIMKRLPVKSLLQFRSVSKQWKTFIDSPKFIKSYHINHTNPQHHLLVSYKLDAMQIFTSIIDDNTFPQQKFPLTVPKSLSLYTDTFKLISVDGLLCFCRNLGTKTMAVIWNPTIRKSVGIDIPIPEADSIFVVVGFGVCPDTSDPKLVKISVDEISSIWEVEVFTLSTRVWKIVFMGVPFKSGDFHGWFQVFVNGVMYLRGCDDISKDDGVRSNIVISFDLKSEKFGEVCLPEKLVRTPYLDVAKVNESLGLLEYYYKEGGIWVCDVWTRKDGADKTFSNIYTVKVEVNWFFGIILGFRNNGEVVITVGGDDDGDGDDDDDDYEDFFIEVYEPLSGHTRGVGIQEKTRTFTATSYMESLLLLDESDSIIY